MVVPVKACLMGVSQVEFDRHGNRKEQTLNGAARRTVSLSAGRHKYRYDLFFDGSDPFPLRHTADNMATDARPGRRTPTLSLLARSTSPNIHPASPTWIFRH